MSKTGALVFDLGLDESGPSPEIEGEELIYPAQEEKEFQVFEKVMQELIKGITK